MDHIILLSSISFSQTYTSTFMVDQIIISYCSSYQHRYAITDIPSDLLIQVGEISFNLHKVVALQMSNHLDSHEFKYIYLCATDN